MIIETRRVVFQAVLLSDEFQVSEVYWGFYRIFIVLIHNTGFILKMTDKIMCLAWTSRKSDWKERTSERRDFKSFFSLLPLGTRTELLGRSFPEGLTNEILFRTKNLTNFAEKNAYFNKSEKMISTENQCYLKIVPYCRKIFHEVSLPVGWIWSGSGFGRDRVVLFKVGRPDP